ELGVTHDLVGTPVDADHGGAQRRVPAAELGDRESQRRNVELALESHPARQIQKERRRVELIQEPKAVLSPRERPRKRRIVGHVSRLGVGFPGARENRDERVALRLDAGGELRCEGSVWSVDSQIVAFERKLDASRREIAQESYGTHETNSFLSSRLPARGRSAAPRPTV